MNPLTLEPSKSTPAIQFNSTGRWEISGKSCPENVFAFYEPVFVWMRSYFETGNPVDLHIRLTYFNTSSSKSLLDFFELLAEYNAELNRVGVHWYYEADDEDMLESGEEFAEDVNLPFTFVRQE